MLYKEISALCEALVQEFDAIPAPRKESLLQLRNYIAGKFNARETPQLVVICTHNSRRSHIGQLWLAVAADYFKLPEIQTFSGGTEATAFNIRAVQAFQKLGFRIEAVGERNEGNPIYEVAWREQMVPYRAFSKRYEDAPNPQEQFAAIMVCSEADEACPSVFGCDLRLALPYEDPKKFDGTALEQEKYEERIRQIGREMLFVMREIGRP